MWWRAKHGAVDVEAFGPYRAPSGRVTAMTAREQADWAESIGGRLPTAAEFDAIWHCACVQVAPKPRNVVTASLMALDDDVHKALAERGEDTERIAAGKTWLLHSQSSASRATNYGWHVPANEVDRSTSSWRGIRIYPDSAGGHVIQPAAQAHSWGHVDYSQLGYAVRDPQDADTDPAPSSAPVTEPAPTPTSRGDDPALVRAWQTYLVAYFESRGEYALPHYGPDGDHGGETEQWTQRWRMLTGEPEPSAPALAISFRQAVSYTPARRHGAPIWVVIHTAELLEHSASAERLQSWAASGAIGVSWHYAVSDTTIAQSVREEHTAWAAPGANARGIQIELAGYARQTPEQWADAFSSAQLELCAQLVAGICERHGIPVQKVGAAEMLSGEAGICGHSDVTAGVGKGRTNHGDPGKHFPWVAFINMVRESL